jgi:integrase/recombinase XerD
MISLPTTSVALDMRKKATGINAGKYPVKLRVTFKEFIGGVKIWNRQYYSSPKGKFFVSQEEFKQITGKTRNTELAEIRREFVSMEARANNLIKEFDINDQETFELHFLSTGNVRSIKPLFDAKIAELYHPDNNQISSAEKYESALSLLIEFGGPDLTFGEITERWLKAFQNWYTSEKRDDKGNIIEKGFSVASLGFHLRCLRHIYKRAIAKRLVTADQYPFGNGRYTIQSVNNSIVSYLDDEFKNMFVNYRSDNPNENYYHDFWRLSYYCNGANMKDILLLQRKDINPKYLEFDRKKTINTDRELKKIIVPIVSTAPSGKAILEITARHGSKDLSPDAYVFPVLSHTMSAAEKHEAIASFVRKCNKVSRRIAKALGIEEDVTTYTARHTYSYIKVNVLGASTEMLQDDLGHGSASTTEEYKKKFALKVKSKYAEGL